MLNKSLQKLSVIMLMFIFFITSVSAGTTYLDSCGKNNGWLSNEVYVLNFTEIPTSYAVTYCFILDDNIENTTIIGNIILDKKGLTDGIFYPGGNNRYNNLTFRDFDVTGSTTRFFLDSLSGNQTIRDSQFINISVTNFYEDFMTSANPGNPNFFENNFFTDLNIHVEQGVMDYTANSLKYNNFQDSVLVGGQLFPASYPQFNNFTNIVVVTSNVDIPNINSNNIFTNSIIQGYQHVDANDDNVADSNIYAPDIINAVMYTDMYGVRWVQDTTEGRIGYTTIGNNDLFVIQGGQMTYAVSDIVLPTASTGKIILNPQQDFYAMTRLAIDLGNNNKLDCNYFQGYEPYCFIEDHVNSTSDFSLYRGMVSVGNNNIITYTSMQKVNAIPLHMIANNNDNLKNNVTIHENLFIKNDGLDSSAGENAFIKLQVSDLDMYNNVYNTNAGANYSVLNIESTLATTNKIYNNTFTSSHITPESNEVFDGYCDTDFYMNDLSDSSYVITKGCTGSLNVSPIVPYLHTDGKIYYFQLGNYYGACTDADANGICDSPKVSGAVTDTHPLSSYPFDFTSHLLTADFVVDSLAFNITLTQPTDNQTIEVADSGEGITFGFNHDSDFPDLTCDFVIDGAVEQQLTNVVKTTTHTETFTGWTSKAYTYRVECYNDLAFEASTEISFTVVVGGVPPSNGNNETPPVTGNGEYSGLFTNAEIIDFDDPEGTAEDVLGFFENFILFSLNYILPFAMILILLLAVLAIFIMVA